MKYYFFVFVFDTLKTRIRDTHYIYLSCIDKVFDKYLNKEINRNKPAYNNSLSSVSQIEVYESPNASRITKKAKKIQIIPCSIENEKCLKSIFKPEQQ